MQSWTLIKVCMKNNNIALESPYRCTGWGYSYAFPYHSSKLRCHWRDPSQKDGTLERDAVKLAGGLLYGSPNISGHWRSQYSGAKPLVIPVRSVICFCLLEYKGPGHFYQSLRREQQLVFIRRRKGHMNRASLLGWWSLLTSSASPPSPLPNTPNGSWHVWNQRSCRSVKENYLLEYLT